MIEFQIVQEEIYVLYNHLTSCFNISYFFDKLYSPIAQKNLAKSI